ncbi:MAG: adenosylcobinamide-GDP ribazoletransferase [Roseibium sp.]|nr:adenosylcobinamide-GDP ribazoletransferase [Roseibium sp.]
MADADNNETAAPARPRAGTTASSAASLVADTAACVRFFSRLPLPRTGALDDPAAPPDFSRIARAAPLAGAFVALPAAGLGLILGYSALPTLVTGFVVVAALAAVTGALHEDGLSDTADGFFGGANPQRRLEIMKDSRIGAFGAIALVVSIGMKAALIAGLLDRFGAADAMVVLLASEAVSRAALVWQWAGLPSARPEGLGARFGRPTGRSAATAAGLALFCALPAMLQVPLTAAALGIGAAVLAAYGIGRMAKSKIDGVTGDVLGAIQQIGALAFLLGVLGVAAT